jgi:hypothetical protein
MAEKKPSAAMAPNQFNNVVRWIKKWPAERVMALRHATWDTLKRVGVKRNAAKAVPGIPAGTDDGNMGDVFAWLAKVQKGDRKAVKQLVALDATAFVRTEG